MVAVQSGLGLIADELNAPISVVKPQSPIQASTSLAKPTEPHESESTCFALTADRQNASLHCLAEGAQVARHRDAETHCGQRRGSCWAQGFGILYEFRKSC